MSQPMIDELKPLFEPESIAVIGASNSPVKWGNWMVTRPIRSGFRGQIYPINPKDKEVFGLKAYPSVLEVPESIDLAIITFGQGVSVTPLQLITAFSCIANGGNLMKPYLVERITDGRGKNVEEFSPEVRRKVLSAELCRRITTVLKEVVRSGTGIRARIPGYEVAGKTATAQKIDRATGKYSEEKVIASFMGYLPADKPRVAILVLIDEPKRTPYGGAAATPIFKRISEELMRYMGVPPTEGDVGKHLTLTQVPYPKKQRGKKEKFAQHRMPDLRGLSMRQALTRLEKERVRVRLAGSGILVGQRPNPGDALTEGCEVFLEFTPPL